MTTKVLIADDEPDVLESTGMLVESLGYRVTKVRDPAAVLEAIERERPGLVLQDLRMGGLNVAGLMASLRSNPDTADIPVVFFSANADLPTIAARYDAWGYLAKPFGQEELRRLLQNVAGEATALRPLREVRRDVRSAFHDYWNLLAALNNYAQILSKADPGAPETRRVVQGLGELVLKMESKTDRLRNYVLGLLDSLDPEGASEKDPEDGSRSVEGQGDRPDGTEEPSGTDAFGPGPGAGDDGRPEAGPRPDGQGPGTGRDGPPGHDATP